MKKHLSKIFLCIFLISVFAPVHNVFAKTAPTNSVRVQVFWDKDTNRSWDEVNEPILSNRILKIVETDYSGVLRRISYATPNEVGQFDLEYSANGIVYITGGDQITAYGSRTLDSMTLCPIGYVGLNYMPVIKRNI